MARQLSIRVNASPVVSVKEAMEMISRVVPPGQSARARTFRAQISDFSNLPKAEAILLPQLFSQIYKVDSARRYLFYL
jgi:hypothetical protein